jgi:hypothetical protein
MSRRIATNMLTKTFRKLLARGISGSLATGFPAFYALWGLFPALLQESPPPINPNEHIPIYLTGIQ